MKYKVHQQTWISVVDIQLNMINRRFKNIHISLDDFVHTEENEMNVILSDSEMLPVIFTNHNVIERHGAPYTLSAGNVIQIEDRYYLIGMEGFYLLDQCERSLRILRKVGDE